MQSLDPRGRMISSSQVDPSRAEEMTAQMQQAEKQGAVSHTVGMLPKNGNDVVINGLRYRTVFADYVKGKFTVKLVLK